VAFLEWYFEQSVLARLVIPAIFLGISTYLFFAQDIIWIWGWVIGGVLLISCIPSKKTHDWGDW